MTQDNETPVSDNVVLFPQGKYVELEVDGAKQMHYVPQFKLGKTLRMLSVLSEFGERTDLASLFKGADEKTFGARLFERLPDMITAGRPLLMKALALAIMPDKRVKEVDLNGEDFDAALNPYLSLVYDADVEKATEILGLAIDGMGIDQIRKNLPTLLKKLGSM